MDAFSRDVESFFLLCSSSSWLPSLTGIVSRDWNQTFSALTYLLFLPFCSIRNNLAGLRVRLTWNGHSRRHRPFNVFCCKWVLFSDAWHLSCSALRSYNTGSHSLCLTSSTAFFFAFPYRTFWNTLSTCRTPWTRRSANLRTSVCTAQHKTLLSPLCELHVPVFSNVCWMLSLRWTEREVEYNSGAADTAASDLNKKEVIRNLLYRGWHLWLVCKRYWIQILAGVSTILTKFFFVIFLLPTRHMPD